ncbi:hypothetical protein V5N11_012218 [Cardamine amara subsp. amara]|uniref:Aspartic peptidase DDI1-type domain-containing protein n=1 Tax=Cardamine amara subsp. amara TaxID=228776 RepID=A0ABD1BLJ9_CARAN
MLNGDIGAEEFEQMDEKLLAMLSEEIEVKDDELPEPVTIDTTHRCRSTPTATDDTDFILGVSDDRHNPSNDRHSSQTDPEIEKTPKIVEERVYKPKIPYPKTPRHLKRPITAEKLLGFEKMVRRIPQSMSFKEALQFCPLLSHFRDCRETLEEIEVLFIQARHTPPSLKQLVKKEDPGKFSVPCSISGVEFKKSLVNSGSSVNVKSRAIAEKLRIGIRPAEMTLTFANSSTSFPYCTIPDLFIKVGDCLVPTDFQIVEMSERSNTPLILGRPFMATVGAVIDTPSKRISFSYIDKEIFYKAIPSGKAPKHISCITVVTEEMLNVDILEEPYDEPTVIAVLDGPSIITKRDITTAKAKKKGQSKRVKDAAYMTLVPQKCDGDSIEYKVKCKAVDDMVSKVLMLNMHDHRVRGPRLNPPPPLPDPSSDSHHL